MESNKRYHEIRSKIKLLKQYVPHELKQASDIKILHYMCLVLKQKVYLEYLKGKCFNLRL